MRISVLFLLITPLSLFSQNNAEYYFDIGLKNQENDLNNMAINSFTQAIELNPNYFDAYYFRGVSKMMIRDFESAVVDFSKAIELNPIEKFKIANAYGLRGESKVVLGDKESACEDFSQASELGDSRSDTLYNRLCLDIKKVEKKVEENSNNTEITKKLNKGPSGINWNSPCLSWRTLLFFGGIDLKWPPDRKEFEYLDYYLEVNKNISLFKRDLKESIKILNYFIKLMEKYPELKECNDIVNIKYSIAKYKYSDKDYYGTIKDISDLVKKNPKHLKMLDFYILLGDAKYEINDYYGSIYEYTKAIEINSEYAKAYSRRAFAKEALGDISGYCKDLRIEYQLMIKNGVDNPETAVIKQFLDEYGCSY